MSRDDRRPDVRDAAGRRSRDELEEIAADWIARRNGGGLTADEQASLNTWIAADARHARAFEAMAAAWDLLGEPRRTGQEGHVRAEMQKGQRRRQARAWATAGLAAAALVLVVFTLNTWRPGGRSGPVPVAVRPDIRLLPDGSTVELNAGADIAVAFTAAERGVRLLRGEALFGVTKDPARPFVVTAGAVVVRAVGTAFTVRHEENRINVLVTEGRVAVDRIEPPGGPEPERVRRSDPVYVDIGRQVAIPIDLPALPPLQVTALSAGELAAALAWRDKRVEFTDAMLPDVVALFNRQNQLQLQIASPALTGRSITGVFWSDDPEGFVRLLESGFGVKARRVGGTISLVSE